MKKPFCRWACLHSSSSGKGFRSLIWRRERWKSWRKTVKIEIREIVLIGSRTNKQSCMKTRLEKRAKESYRESCWVKRFRPNVSWFVLGQELTKSYCMRNMIIGFDVQSKLILAFQRECTFAQVKFFENKRVPSESQVWKPIVLEKRRGARGKQQVYYPVFALMNCEKPLKACKRSFCSFTPFSASSFLVLYKQFSIIFVHFSALLAPKRFFSKDLSKLVTK